MNRDKPIDDDGVCELREPVAAYDPRPPARTTPEPWTPTAAGTCVADADGYGDAFDDFDEPLPDGWEEEILNDPEIRAEAIRRSERIDAEIAAGTWRGYSTEEVFDRLHKKFPQLLWY